MWSHCPKMSTGPPPELTGLTPTAEHLNSRDKGWWACQHWLFLLPSPMSWFWTFASLCCCGHTLPSSVARHQLPDWFSWLWRQLHAMWYHKVWKTVQPRPLSSVRIRSPEIHVTLNPSCPIYIFSPKQILKGQFLTLAIWFEIIKINFQQLTSEHKMLPHLSYSPHWTLSIL